MSAATLPAAIHLFAHQETLLTDVGRRGTKRGRQDERDNDGAEGCALDTPSATTAAAGCLVTDDDMGAGSTSSTPSPLPTQEIENNVKVNVTTSCAQGPPRSRIRISTAAEDQIGKRIAPPPAPTTTTTTATPTPTPTAAATPTAAVKPVAAHRQAVRTKVATFLRSFVASTNDIEARLAKLTNRLEQDAFDSCMDVASYQASLRSKLERLRQLRTQKQLQQQQQQQQACAAAAAAAVAAAAGHMAAKGGTTATAATLAPSAATPVEREFPCVFWEWQHPRGHWVRYLHSDQIERYAQADHSVLRYALGCHVYELDLTAGVQRNVNSSTTRRIRRIETFGGLEAAVRAQQAVLAELASLPPTWDPPCPSQGAAPTLKPVPVDSDEFAEVAAAFKDSRIPTRHIKAVHRVEAPLLWHNYKMKCATIAATNGGDPREARLFHGTSAAAIDPICAQGFNRAFGGQHGAALGTGVYFALDSGYSCQPKFAPNDTNGDCHVIMARVAVGQYCRGDKTMRAPPPIPGAPHKHALFDSVVDREENPAIFAVFHDAQAYPEYVITC